MKSTIHGVRSFNRSPTTLLKTFLVDWCDFIQQNRFNLTQTHSERFNVAMTEKAYARLRALNADYGFGNNYLLTFLLENLDEIVDQDALDRVFRELIDEWGAPDRKS